MRRFIFATLFMAGLTPAIAQHAKVQQDPEAAMNPMKLTIGDCLEILNGLTALDQLAPAAAPALPAPRFEFPSPNVRLDIAHNIAILNAERAIAQKEQQKIFVEVLKTIPEKDGKPATEIAPNSLASVEFDRRNREILAQPCRVAPFPINAVDLNLERNQIPLTSLSQIDRILKR